MWEALPGSALPGTGLDRRKGGNGAGRGSGPPRRNRVLDKQGEKKIDAGVLMNHHALEPQPFFTSPTGLPLPKPASSILYCSCPHSHQPPSHALFRCPQLPSSKGKTAPGCRVVQPFPLLLKTRASSSRQQQALFQPPASPHLQCLPPLSARLPFRRLPPFLHPNPVSTAEAAGVREDGSHPRNKQTRQLPGVRDPSPPELLPPGKRTELYHLFSRLPAQHGPL